MRVVDLCNPQNLDGRGRLVREMTAGLTGVCCGTDVRLISRSVSSAACRAVQMHCDIAVTNSSFDGFNDSSALQPRHQQRFSLNRGRVSQPTQQRATANEYRCRRTIA
jgi:hypothetical protein